MVSELHTKSQVTIPKEIVSNMGLSVGDKFEIVERNGMICLIPVEVYPKKYIQDLQAEVNRAKNDIKTGETPVFDTVDQMLDFMEQN